MNYIPFCSFSKIGLCGFLKYGNISLLKNILEYKNKMKLMESRNSHGRCVLAEAS